MDRNEAHARWTVAVESYRRSVDLYRQVLELRARQRHGAGAHLRVELPPVAPIRASVVTVTPVPASRLDPLTVREREVAYLIARGFTNSQIAETLVVTRGTVANHVAHILSKLTLSNRTQLAAYITREQNGAEVQQIAG